MLHCIVKKSKDCIQIIYAHLSRCRCFLSGTKCHGSCLLYTSDTESYETSEGHKCPSFLLVPTVVTKDNMKEELVDTGYYTQDDDGYLHPAQ